MLPPLLRERRITGRDAAFATELAYGTLRLRGRYDAIIAAGGEPRGQHRSTPPRSTSCGSGVHQLLGMRVPAHAAVSETVGLAREQLGTGPSQFVNAVLRTVGRSSPQEWEDTHRARPRATTSSPRLAVVESHPLWVVRALREALVGQRAVRRRDRRAARGRQRRARA